MSFPALEDQWALISRGVEEIIPEDELKKKISQSLPMITLWELQN